MDDRTLRAGLYNLSLHNTREDIIRAFLEGIAFNTRWLLEPVEKFMGRKVTSIHIVGGGAQSDVWCQIFADVMNVEIRQVQDPIYANARGAAWIARGRAGRDRLRRCAGAGRRFKQHLSRRSPQNTGLYTMNALKSSRRFTSR